MKAYKRIHHKFNPNRPAIKQIFCRHEWEHKRDNYGWYRVYYLQCKKCGKFRDMNFYSNKRW